MYSKVRNSCFIGLQKPGNWMPQKKVSENIYVLKAYNFRSMVRHPMEHVQQKLKCFAI